MNKIAQKPVSGVENLRKGHEDEGGKGEEVGQQHDQPSQLHGEIPDLSNL